MAETSIEWAEHVWNPIVGCSVVSPGCTNCYAMKMAARLEAMGTPRYAGLTKPSKAGPVWTGELRLVEDALTIPLRRRKPTTYFVNSMSDLFHEAVPDAWIDRVFAVMALAPQHTFQVLTKRSARMRAYLAGCRGRLWNATVKTGDQHCTRPFIVPFYCIEGAATPDKPEHWPLPNVWLGVSAEDQRRADERVPDLLATPAAVRFVSAEPLLGPIDLSAFMWPVHGWWKGPHNSYAEAKAAGAECGLKRQALVGAWCTFLDWVIVGGESGPKARPMHPAWARSIRDQCRAAGVHFLFKQWGEWAPYLTLTERAREAVIFWPDGTSGYGAEDKNGGRGVSMGRVGKAKAGRLLDCVEHNGMPEARI